MACWTALERVGGEGGGGGEGGALRRRAGASLLSRREVLKAASLGALAGALGGFAAAAEAIAAARVEALAVGYLEDSDGYPDFRVLPWQLPDFSEWGELEVVPAAAMPLGDQTLASTTVEMAVHGLYPRVPARRQAGFDLAFLTVFFPSPDPALPEPLPFDSWGLKLVPGPSTGAPLRFPVPLGLDGGLEVVLDLVRPQSAAAPLARYYANFTVDWYDGRPKLQRGVYLLGLRPELWQSSWTALPDPQAKAARALTSLAVSFERLPEE
jgi:hypothetical protein